MLISYLLAGLLANLVYIPHVYMDEILIHILRTITALSLTNQYKYICVIQADPTSVDPAKLSPNRARRSTGGRSMSVQSSLDPYGSNTTLASTGSSEMDSGRISSGGGADTHSGSPHGRSSS